MKRNFIFSVLIFISSPFIESPLFAQTVPKSLKDQYSYVFQCQQAYQAFSIITSKADKKLSGQMTEIADYYLAQFIQIGSKLGKSREQIGNDFSTMANGVKFTDPKNEDKMYYLLDNCKVGPSFKLKK
jgi:hypothetical protein